MSVTTDDLAMLCKVSRGTVDRALNNRPGISEKTRQRILQTAKEVGYVPHLLASSLATGKTRTVGVIVFDLNNQHFTQLVESIEHTCWSNGMFTYVCITNKDKDKEIQLLEDLAARKVDGILMTPINEGDAFVEHIGKLGLPIIAINNRLGDLPYVGGNNEQASYDSAAHFYRHGYREIHLVCPPLRKKGSENIGAQIERANGYRRFLSEHADVHGEIIDCPDYWARVRSLIDSSPGTPGFMCTSDVFALNIYWEALQDGLGAPKDFGLMGFDNVAMLRFLPQRIDTVLYPADEIGRRAAELLLSQIANRSATIGTHLFDCPIINGGTV